MVNRISKNMTYDFLIMVIMMIVHALVVTMILADFFMMMVRHKAVYQRERVRQEG